MAINSLGNFGTPGSEGTRGAALQPILRNRFRVLFHNFGSEIYAPYELTRHCKSIGLPNVEWEEQTLYTYSQPTYIVNRGEWQTITVTFYNDIMNEVMSRVENQMAKQQNFYDQTYARAAENYKFEIDLDILAGGATAGGGLGDPNVVQKWCFVGCMVTGRDYGDMNVGEQDTSEISLTVRYDNAIGFDQYGNRLGEMMSHTAEINGRIGQFSTGFTDPS